VNYLAELDDIFLVMFIFSVIIINPLLGFIVANSNYPGTANFVYGQTSQIISKNNMNSLDVQNIIIKKVRVADIDIAYRVFGKGNPLLLISGSGLVMDAWEPIVLKDLSANHTVIIFDNRGVGNTTSGTRPFSMVQFANDVAGFLDALKIQKADVLGFSMGSFIAQELGVLHPEKVNRLILYGASCGGKDGIPQSIEVVRILSDFVNNRSQDPEKVLSVTFPLAWIKSHPNVTLPSSNEIIIPYTLREQFNLVKDWFAKNWSGVCDQLAKSSIPTLVITGTEDISVPAANSLIIVEKIPGAWLVQIKGGGHGLMYQYPEKFGKIVIAFLENSAA
jgi:pimeloyl-ACP methyl ester carboxylesterase